MYTVRLSELELPEAGYENDPTMRAKASFPFSAATGTKSAAVVYFELEPGHRLGTHTDSAEEILLLLGGTAEVSVGDEQGRVSAGEMALVPAMVPHSVRNVGDQTVRVVGFFSSSTNMATFDQPLVPMGQPPSEPPFGQRTFLVPFPVARAASSPHGRSCRLDVRPTSTRAGVLASLGPGLFRAHSPGPRRAEGHRSEDRRWA
jgi:quercetin dioxygenase-like cupin family protein